MLDISEGNAVLKKRLSKKRYNHSLNVADEAEKLAQLYNADVNKAYIAGLYHDICKEAPFEEQKELMLASKLSVSKVELSSKPLWHAVAGAHYVREEIGISDMDIINAIRYHTIGRAGMTLLEEIIYLADLISIDRTHKDVAKMRKLAYFDIEKAMFEALCFSIDSVIKKKGYIPYCTADAYNQYAYCMSRRKKAKEKNNVK